jgi:hypothetical protein
VRGVTISISVPLAVIAGTTVAACEVAGHHGGDQAALDIGAEDLPGHGVVDDEGRGYGIGAQTGHKGGGLPMTVRHPPDQPRTAARAPTPAGHVGGGAGLVDEHQPARIKLRLEAFPQQPRALADQPQQPGRVPV